MDIIIIGGGYAGLACAFRLAHQARRHSMLCRIRLVNREDHLVERIRLPQMVTGQPLPYRRISGMLHHCGVELVLGNATSVDLGAQRLEVEGHTLCWDRLVVAVGSQSGSGDRPYDALAVNPDSSAQLLERLRSLAQGACIEVVGGGLTILKRSPDACRQVLRRARRHLDVLKGMSESAEQHRELLARFLTAMREGDIAGLARLFAEDVESRADGGGYVRAATKPVVGVRAVSRLFVGFSKDLPPDL